MLYTALAYMRRKHDGIQRLRKCIHGADYAGLSQDLCHAADGIPRPCTRSKQKTADSLFVLRSLDCVNARDKMKENAEEKM